MARNMEERGRIGDNPDRGAGMGTCGKCGMELRDDVCSGCGRPPGQCTCK